MVIVNGALIMPVAALLAGINGYKPDIKQKISSASKYLLAELIFLCSMKAKRRYLAVFLLVAFLSQGSTSPTVTIKKSSGFKVSRKV